MKIFVGIIAFIVLIFCGLVHYVEDYTIKGVIYDKAITSGTNGSTVYYHVLVKYEDGTVEDIIGLENYLHFSKGTTYIFTKQRFKLSKK